MIIKQFEADEKLRSKVIKQYRNNHPKWKKAAIIGWGGFAIIVGIGAIAAYFFLINSLDYKGVIDKADFILFILVFGLLFNIPTIFYLRHMRFNVCNGEIDNYIAEKLIFTNDTFKETYYHKNDDMNALCSGCEIAYSSIQKIEYNPTAFTLKVYGKFANVTYTDRDTDEINRKIKSKNNASFTIYMYYNENEDIKKLLEEKSRKQIEITDRW